MWLNHYYYQPGKVELEVKLLKSKTDYYESGRLTYLIT